MPSGFSSVVQDVLARAAAAPERIAVAGRSGLLTYGELARRSAILAGHLRDLGVGPEVVVGIQLRRSPAQVVAALAVLRAGGAFLPVDPDDPPARVLRILEEARSLLLVGAANDPLPGFPRERWIGIDELAQPVRAAGCAPLPSEPRIAPGDLAYVIATSGSTGEPKCVELMHAGLSNLVRWHLDAFNVRPSDRASAVARVAFDAAIWETWPYLAAGASVHLPDDEPLSSAETFRDWLVREKITIAFAPTALAERMIALRWPAHTALRVLLTGADALQRRPASGLPFAFVNNYGPTECTVVATSGLVEPAGPDESPTLPSIGRPIASIEAHVLDERLRPVPPGQSGELCLAGPGVARGYRGRPDLTAQRFVPNPFGSGEFARLFRTGDRVRRLPEGALEFLGRMDDQVKIRGFRVEPKEIEAALQRHPAAQRCVVLARSGSNGEKRLVGYLELRPGARLRLREVREFLGDRLPDYMIPAAFVVVPAMPLNANGKIDRAALPEPRDAAVLRDDEPSRPRTATETAIAELLASLLGLDQVGVDSNFFELGGHSLLGTQLIVRLRDALGVELPLRTVFESPTVEALAAEVDRLLLACIQPA